MILLLLLVSAATPCTAKIKFKASDARDKPAKFFVSKKEKITLVSSDDKLVEIKTSKRTLFADVELVNKACDEAALASLAPEVEPTGSLRVGKAVELPPEPASAPVSSAPVVIAPPPPPPPVSAAPKKERSADKIKIAIMDLKASDQVPKELRAALTALIPQTLDELGPFKAISKQDIEQMLALEAMKESIGCNEVSCLAEIGGALGADYLVTGSVVLVGDTYLTQLQLLNIKTSRPEQRFSREFKGGPQGLLEEMRFGAKMIVRELLAARSGTLALSVSEEGATVRVDGSIVGTTPLKPMALSGGPHTIIVEREQFVRHSEDVSIDENKESKLDVVLMPSEDFKKSYKQKAVGLRVGAWLATGLGVALAGTGIALLVVNQGNAAALERDSLTFNEAGTRPQADYDALRGRQTSVNTLDAVSIAAMVTGVAAVGVGITLFVVGDKPDKYDNVTTETKVSLLLGPNRAGLKVTY
jgi:hypothetical protein